MREVLKSVFDNDYQGYPVFIDNVLRPIFGDDMEVLPVKEKLDIDSETLQKASIKELYRVATIDKDDTDIIDVFDVTLDDKTVISRSRVGIQRIIRSAIFQYTHAFMLFHYENPEGRNWRFSYAYKQDKNSTTTEAKRYTYLFGQNLHCRTAIDRFAVLAKSSKDNKALLDAFSVEALSDEFFDTYRKQYAKFVKYITGKEFVKEGGKWVEKQTGIPNDVIFNVFSREDKRVRDYIKKMMGRITFLHFLQRKRWMNEDLNFMLHLFQNSDKQDNYLEAVLEPLFFGILNTKSEDRAALFAARGWNVGLLKEWENIPYLNGGLFEADEEDNVSVTFPKEYFAELFAFYAEYNFTVDENDPDDAEVGVDPEMLGKIFENLLEDNKDKGAFYTPKEIVRYMCQESLIAYLVGKSGIEEQKIRDFVMLPYDTVGNFEDKELEDLLKYLDEVKICDPAIGSGAFPMGLLNELVRCEEAIVLGQEKNTARAELKKSIIKNNIYGVDIEKGAVDIARLRFWLSLVVDEDKPMPLPNLDYKIMQGNSLLESYNGVDLSHLLKPDETDLFSSTVIPIQMQLESRIDEYYTCGDHRRKLELKEEIKDLIVQLPKDKGIKEIDLSGIDVTGNTHFFLWHTWFSDVFKRPSDCNGFDIVIGNPPYVSVRTKNFDVSLKPIYKQRYKLAVGQYDLYVLFIEQAYHLLSDSGTLSYIVPTRLLSNENFMPTRLFLKEKLFINRYVNAEAPFETASVEANIMVCSKSLKSEAVASYKYDNNTKQFDLLVLADRDVVQSMPFSIFPFVYTNEILGLFSKIQNAATKPLGGYIDITRGLECGYRDSCISSTPTAYPLIKAEQIRRYFIEGKTNLYCTPDFSNPSKYKTIDVFENKPKLLTKFCSGEIQFALDEVGFYNTNSVYNCNVPDMDTAYLLLGVLNCPITTFWFNIAYMNIDGLFPHIQKNQLESIPIPTLSVRQRSQIINLVKDYLSTKDESILSEINGIVYEFYQIAEGELSVIEG